MCRHERNLAWISAQQLQSEDLQSELDELYSRMVERHLEIIDHQQEELAACKAQLQIPPSSNTSKKIDEVSPRHARGKLATFKISP